MEFCLLLVYYNSSVPRCIVEVMFCIFSFKGFESLLYSSPIRGVRIGIEATSVLLHTCSGSETHDWKMMPSDAVPAHIIPSRFNATEDFFRSKIEVLSWAIPKYHWNIFYFYWSRFKNNKLGLTCFLMLRSTFFVLLLVSPNGFRLGPLVSAHRSLFESGGFFVVKQSELDVLRNAAKMNAWSMSKYVEIKAVVCCDTMVSRFSAVGPRKFCKLLFWCVCEREKEREFVFVPFCFFGNAIASR